MCCVRLTGECYFILVSVEVQSSMMQRFWQRPLLLCVTALAAVSVLGNPAEAVDEQEVKNLTNKHLQVIPLNNNTCVTKLVIKGNLITLNETDRDALASYPSLVELHLDGNQVTALPAKFFSVVPRLRVLSVSGNNISSVNPESFFGLDGLTELDLSHNLLTSLPTQLLTQLNNLQVLALQGNPWNCSCPLLLSMTQVKAANISTAGRVTCACPENKAGQDVLEAAAACYPSPSHTEKAPTSLNFKQYQRSSTTLQPTSSSSQNSSTGQDQTAALGNTWKFTICIAALALTTCLLIVCAVKGPSWYKLFHNYRHQRLDSLSGVFSDTGPYVRHQTFTFNQDNKLREEGEEEDEDVYFEDPYVKRDEQQEN